MRMFSLNLTAVLMLTLVSVEVARAAPEPLVSLEHGAPVCLLAFSPDGKTLASGAGGGSATIRLWDLGERELIADIDFHRAGITGLAFTPDSKHLASCGWDTLVCLWDVSTGAQIRSFAGHEEGVTGVAISPDGKLLATGSIDGRARIFDLATGKELREYLVRKRDKRDRVMAVAFSADGMLLATCEDQQPGVRLWDVKTGKEAYQPGPGKDSPRARHFKDSVYAEQRYHGNIIPDYYRCRLASQGVQLRQFGSHPSSSFDHFAPDGRTLAYGVGRLVLLESATGQDRFQQSRFEYVTAAAFAPDGRRLAWAEGKQGEILLWDLAELVVGNLPKDRPTAKQLDFLWSSLAGSAPDAYRAGWVLTAAPADSVAFLLEKALARPEVDPDRVEALIADLDGTSFAARQKAAEKLEALGASALSALRKKLAANPSLEFTRRGERLTVVMEERLRAEMVRGVRTVEVLERIATPEAVAALGKLAHGPTIGPDAEEAAVHALRRLKK